MWLAVQSGILPDISGLAAPTTKLRSKVLLPYDDTGKPVYATCLSAHGSASSCSARTHALRQST